MSDNIVFDKVAVTFGHPDGAVHVELVDRDFPRAGCVVGRLFSASAREVAERLLAYAENVDMTGMPDGWRREVVARAGYVMTTPDLDLTVAVREGDDTRWRYILQSDDINHAQGSCETKAEAFRMAKLIAKAWGIELEIPSWAESEL